jgi:hypothetical protein
MKILFDTRDLINLLEHNRPIAMAAINEYLTATGDHLVLTFSNVRELAGPLGSGLDFLPVRALLQKLESLPHTYLKETFIPSAEIRAAVDAFNQGREFEKPDLSCDRWDKTFLRYDSRPIGFENLVNLRLDDIVYEISRVDRRPFTPMTEYLTQYQTLIGQDRFAQQKNPISARDHLTISIKKHALTAGIKLPDKREDEFAYWVHENPLRCPGLNFNHEVYRAIMDNKGDIPEAADFSDLAHVMAIPYIDAATLDKRMRHYCDVASRRIRSRGCVINYSSRIFIDLTDFMKRNPLPTGYPISRS